MPDPVVTVKVNGQLLRAWKEVHIKRSMEEAAHSFGLVYWDRVDLQDRPLPVAIGDSIEIEIDGTLVVTGYVDEASAEETKDDYTLTISGRSAAGDLVDCSAIHQSGSWKQQTILSIASDLVQPFDLTASVDPALDADLSKPIPSFTIQDGETVFDALGRLGRYAGVLPISDPKGNVLFTRSGTTRTATQLTRGVNIMEGRHQTDGRQRFSQYTVKAQSAGTDDWNGEQAAHISASSQDEDVKRYRPLVLVADFDGRAGVQGRATWERNTRAGRAHRWMFITPGWSNAEGLWNPNVLSHTVHERFGLNDDLLILAATLRMDNEGRRTELELGHREGYDVLGLPPPKRGKRRRHLPHTTVRT